MTGPCGCALFFFGASKVHVPKVGKVGSAAAGRFELSRVLKQGERLRVGVGGRGKGRDRSMSLRPSMVS